MYVADCCFTLRDQPFSLGVFVFVFEGQVVIGSCVAQRSTCTSLPSFPPALCCLSTAERQVSHNTLSCPIPPVLEAAKSDTSVPPDRLRERKREKKRERERASGREGGARRTKKRQRGRADREKDG